MSASKAPAQATVQPRIKNETLPLRFEPGPIRHGRGRSDIRNPVQGNQLAPSNLETLEGLPTRGGHPKKNRGPPTGTIPKKKTQNFRPEKGPKQPAPNRTVFFHFPGLFFFPHLFTISKPDPRRPRARGGAVFPKNIGVGIHKKNSRLVHRGGLHMRRSGHVFRAYASSRTPEKLTEHAPG